MFHTINPNALCIYLACLHCAFMAGIDDDDEHDLDDDGDDFCGRL